MLAFWPSDAVLVGTQAVLVCGPRPRLPAPLLCLRTSLWAWLLLPVSLGGTIALLAVVPALGIGYAWVAQIGVPVLAGISIAAMLSACTSLARRAWVGAVVAVALFAASWAGHQHLGGEAAAVVLTALSACALASYLAQLAPHGVLKLGLVAMASLDAVLVFGHLLEGPNNTLNAATPGLQMPHLQVALFGSALIGYGDLFVAAVLGNLLDGTGVPRWAAALLVLGCSWLFDLLFFVVDELPATVPVAVAMLLLEAWYAARGGRIAGWWIRRRRAAVEPPASTSPDTQP